MPLSPTESYGPVRRWVEAFRRAWQTDDPAEVADLWSEDVVYYASPFAEPWVGRDQVVREWLALGESAIAWEFDYELVNEDPDAAVIIAHVTYPPDEGRGLAETVEYRNVWIVRLDDDGRAREFTEYWVKKP